MVRLRRTVAAASVLTSATVLVLAGCAASPSSVRAGFSLNYPDVAESYAPASDSTTYRSRPSLLRYDARQDPLALKGIDLDLVVVAYVEAACPGTTRGSCKPAEVALVVQATSPERRLGSHPRLHLRVGTDTLAVRDPELVLVTPRELRPVRGQRTVDELVTGTLAYADFLRAAHADTLHGRLDAFDLSATAEDLGGWRALAAQFSGWTGEPPADSSQAK